MKPVLTLLSYSTQKIGKNMSCQVAFETDSALDEFECRATLEGNSYGVGVGDLVHSAKDLVPGARIDFVITQGALTQGDGVYRISLFGRAEDEYFDFGSIDFDNIKFNGEYGEWSE